MLTFSWPSPLTSSITAPGIPLMDIEFHNTSTILDSFAVSVFVLGFAVSHPSARDMKLIKPDRSSDTLAVE